ncbi:MAG: hypothetical protein PUF75_05060 [Coprococcus sp.]|nr:hypothetical protein [Coprococcus sp.]
MRTVLNEESTERDTFGGSILEESFRKTSSERPKSGPVIPLSS